MNLHSQCLDVVCAICTPGEIRQVELNLIPAIVQTHGHRANKWFDSRRRLVVGCSETPINILVIQHHYFECEVLFQIFNDHDQKWQLYAECVFLSTFVLFPFFIKLLWALDVCCTDIGTTNLQNA